MQNNKSKLIGLLASISILLTGCWDRVEIEERGFVLAVGLDLADESEGEKPENQRTPRFTITYQVAVPAKLQSGGKDGGGGAGGGGGGGSGGSGGAPSGQPFMNFTGEGETLFEVVRMMATRSSRALFFEHNRLVVVGEEMARSGQLDKAIDLLLRDHEMRRRMKVLVVKGTAKEALNVSPQQERLPSEYLDSLSENTKRTARIPREQTIGNLSEMIIGKQSFVVQRIIPRANELKMSGAAVFHGHDDTLAGWLEDDDTEGLMWLTGQLKGGLVRTQLSSGEKIVFEIRDVKTKMEPVHVNGRYLFKAHIKTEGSLGESFSTQDPLDEKFNQEIEKAVAKDIQRLTLGTVQKMQKELKADAIGLGSLLARKEPQTWEKIKDDWDHGANYFSKAEVQVEVDAKVIFPGVITSLKKQ